MPSELAIGGPIDHALAASAVWLTGLSIPQVFLALGQVMNALAALYLKTFPRSDRAAKLLLRQAGLVSEEKAAEIARMEEDLRNMQGTDQEKIDAAIKAGKFEPPSNSHLCVVESAPVAWSCPVISTR